MMIHRGDRESPRSPRDLLECETKGHFSLYICTLVNEKKMCFHAYIFYLCGYPICLNRLCVFQYCLFPTGIFTHIDTMKITRKQEEAENSQIVFCPKSTKNMLGMNSHLILRKFVEYVRRNIKLDSSLIYQASRQVIKELGRIWRNLLHQP